MTTDPGRSLLRKTLRDNWPYSTWPERRVVRTGVSPMNPKVKWAQLDCGHDTYRQRRPRIGATVVCEKCAEKADRKDD